MAVNLILRAALAAGAFTTGDTYYVAHVAEGGNALNSGLYGSPMTPAAALAVLQPGDEMVFKNSATAYVDTSATWFQGFNPANSGTEGNYITIRAETLHGVTLESYVDGDETCPAIQPWQRNYIIVDGFNIVGRCGIRGEIPTPDEWDNEESPIYGMYASYAAAFAGVSAWATGHHCHLRNLNVTEGGPEGDDASLNHGIQVHSARDGTVENCKVAGMLSTGNTATNSAAIMVFGCTFRFTIEYCDADGTNVHSGFGQKGGNIYSCTWRYNIARNCRSGDGGTVGCGFLGKGNSGGDTFCDDHIYYGNIAVNCFDGFFLNHNLRRAQIYNNTIYNCTNGMRQWQLNSVDNDYWNNIIHTVTRVYDIEALSGGSPDFEPYIEYSDYNCFYNATNLAQAAYGDQYDNLTAWRAAQIHDDNSITTNPLFTNAAAGDFTLQVGSPALTAGRGGSYATQMGAYGVTSRVGTNF